MMKRIDFSQKTIHANGREYKVLSELPIARFKELDKMEVEFFYGFDMRGMFEKLKATFEDLNKSRIGDASVKVFNLMKGVADRVDKREHIVLRICSLFLVTDGEDLTSWSEEMASEKANDWAKEGYSMTDFFSLVASFLPGYMKSYEEVTADTFLEATPAKTKSQPKKA